MKRFIIVHLPQFLMLSLGLMIPMIVSSAINNNVENQGYYGKHIIIAVDQKSRVQSSTTQLNALKNALRSVLLSNSIEDNPIIEKNASQFPSSDFHFDPDKDELSFFSFGSVPNHKFNSSKDFDATHIKFIGNYSSSQLGLADFIEQKFLVLFSGNGTMGSSFSQLVFAPIIDGLETHHYAREYYIFIVSDLMAGTTGLNSDYDLSRVRPFFTDASYSSYSYEHHQFNNQFYKTDFCSIKTKNTDNSGYASNNNSLVIAGFSIGLKALSGVSVSLGSTISLAQTTYAGDTYEIGEQKLRFTRNSQLRVDRIELDIEDHIGKIIYKETITDTIWDDKEKAYLLQVPNGKMSLGHFSSGDCLNFNFVIYATPLNNRNEALIPFAFCAPTQTYFFENRDFVPAPTRLYILLGVIIILLAIALCAIWYYRGRLVKAKVDVKIDHISKQRYMNVGVNRDDGIHVTNAPCWYLRPGINEQRIHVTCSMERMPLVFARKYYIKLSYMVKDLDQNYDFTFRPDGQESDANLRRVDTWYTVPNTPSSETSVEFEFNAVVYVNQERRPTFIGRENILQLGICFKAELVDSTGNVIKLLDEKNNVPYEFIAKEYFPNRELWMAFDPGTSGSCVAYGFGGTVVDKYNIHLARNYERHTDGFAGWVPIFPSKIRISDSSHLFINPRDVENAQIIQDGNDGDFWFGNAAEQLWGRNSFQSIKKLLGYSNELPIKRNEPRPTSQLIAGRDLAHLLIKGIIDRFEKYLIEYSGGDNGTDDIKALEVVRPKFFETGIFQPSRAIVTVPNNFTLVKILDMVESIRRTKKFKEVHFLYEAEGVLMTYLRENWSRLKQKEEKNIIVFDMGGATINASAFTFTVSMKNHQGNNIIDDVTVRTVARIGYGIGGDDIDYALIQILCSIPSINKCIANRSKFIREYKTQLLKYIKNFKLSYIDKKNNLAKPGNIVTDMATLWGSLRTNFKEWGICLPENFVEEDEKFLKKEDLNHRVMNRYVLNNVKDAITELVTSPNIQSKDVEIIFSGRSTLYPGIKEAVMSCLEKSGFSVTRWTGFDKQNISGVVTLDDEKVKSAVAIGACWYAMWSQYITIRHDIVTSTFGFIDLKDNKEVFHPVVSQGESLVNGHRKHNVAVFDPTNPNIAFIQMLGTNFEEILAKKIYHKMNRIIQLTDIEGDVDCVEIDVDDKNNFRYLVTEKSGVSHGGQDVVKDIDILDENSEAYIYAAFTSEEDAEADGGTSQSNNSSIHLANTVESSQKPSNKRGGGL